MKTISEKQLIVFFRNLCQRRFWERMESRIRMYVVGPNLLMCRKNVNYHKGLVKSLWSQHYFMTIRLRKTPWTDSERRVHIHTDQRAIISFCGWPSKTYSWRPNWKSRRKQQSWRTFLTLLWQYIYTSWRLQTCVFQCEIIVYQYSTLIGFSVYRDRYPNSLQLNYRLLPHCFGSLLRWSINS